MRACGTNLSGLAFGDSMNIAATKGEACCRRRVLSSSWSSAAAKSLFSLGVCLLEVKRRRRSQSRMLGEEVEEEGNVDERNECLDPGGQGWFCSKWTPLARPIAAEATYRTRCQWV